MPRSGRRNGPDAERGNGFWDRRALTGASFPPAPAPRIDARLVAGSVLFGAGWALAGFCPGPALASLGWSGVTGLSFTLAMAGGMIVHARLAARRSLQPA